MERIHKTDAREQMQQRRMAFSQEVFSQYESYDEEMLQQFFDYWTEPNKSRTKMRFELQPTWDLNLRLRTWERRRKDINNRFNQSPNPSDRYAQRRRIEPTAKTAADYKTGF